MREILWFRRDLRIADSAILAHAKKEVLPIFIFDTNILETLPANDKRVSFIYQRVLQQKQELKNIGLDLAIFYGKPLEIFKMLLPFGFSKVLCSVDYDAYAIKRDEEIQTLLEMQRHTDSFLLDPNEALKKDKTPYKVFTPFYKNLEYLWRASCIKEYERNPHLKKVSWEYEKIPSLGEMGFKQQQLEPFLEKSAQTLLEEFSEKIDEYEVNRDFFHLKGTSSISVHLRFGVVSAKQIFNYVRSLKPSLGVECFIKELFWREFYASILYHFPQSEFENFNAMLLEWENSDEAFEAWKNAQTGVPLIDASMHYLNQTGLMPNRLRMVVASFAVKNLLIPWKRGEAYFALKLLDYEASSNIGSWQWAASTGADSVPYFRLFNPYSQSKKFDKEGHFIKSVLGQLKQVDAKLLHIENGLSQQANICYPKPIVTIENSRKKAIQFYKNVAKVETIS